MMKLFLIETKGLGDYYVVDKDPTSAMERLRYLLDKADDGFSSQREVKSIDILTDEVHEFPKGKPFFCEKSRLILPATCMDDSDNISTETKDVI